MTAASFVTYPTTMTFVHRACGKLILFGEHFVVFGAPALAVPARSVQTSVTVCEAADGHPTAVRSVFVAPPGCDAASTGPRAADEDAVRRLLLAALQQLELDPERGWLLEVTSTIPPGAGLGSSASLAVALVGALARASGRELSPPLLARHAHELEKIVHGTPSGIDDTVVAHASPIWFCRGQPAQPVCWPAGGLRLIAAADGARRATRAAVAAVAASRQATPRRFEALYERAAAIARAGRTALEAGDGPRLGELFSGNHELLRQLGVCTAAIDRLVAAATAAGAYGAKLTGAGGGGFIVAAVPAEREAEQRVASALRAAGARQILVEDALPASGSDR